MTDLGSTVDRIKKQTGKSHDEVMRLIRGKWETNMVTLEGAVGMVARELGVEG